jgi:transcriptional regulator with XRE-family HTH domain
MPDNTPNSLAAFLKDRRTRLDPAAFGFSGRRRTPGLRREEVAQRASISPTWYTWLEQGRGGAPSADVLNRIASGLMLTEPEREHLFMLGLGRPPEVRYKSTDGITPRLQRLLDTLDASPAFIKTATWDVVAWNAAAAVVLTDYGKLPEGQRNLLRQIFSSPSLRAKQHDWEGLARFVVGAFRADAARAGAMSEVADLVEELSKSSPEFAAFWGENDVRLQSDGLKRIEHPEFGTIELEYSAFSVDGRPDLGMMIYNPVDPAIAAKIRQRVAERAAAAKS